MKPREPLPTVLQNHQLKNKSGEPLIIGCNYHTTWQSHPGMRFVLTGLKDGKAKLKTRTTYKYFDCSADDLIYISTAWNNDKAKRIIGGKKLC